MAVVFRGNKRELPKGMAPMEYFREVRKVMEDKGVDEREARQIVRDRRDDYEDEEE